MRIPDDAAIVVVHSGVPRTLEQSAYAERRAACERIARELGLRSLRDATLDQVLDEPLGRHVVTENTRVEQTAEALERGDLRRVGELMRESHASLRDDYAVSTPELDALAELLESAGAYGARLTGAGFGGCVVAIAPSAAAERILETAKASYELAWIVSASNGAGPLAASAVQQAVMLEVLRRQLLRGVAHVVGRRGQRLGALDADQDDQPQPLLVVAVVALAQQLERAAMNVVAVVQRRRALEPVALRTIGSTTLTSIAGFARRFSIVRGERISAKKRCSSS